MKVAIGSDHAGHQLKSKIADHLKNAGHKIEDVGTFSEESVDYPDIAEKVAELVSNGDADRGVLVCGTGIGVSIAANKVPGIRAASCSNLEEAIMARRHNDANVVALGARLLKEKTALNIVDAFMNEQFEGGRHQRRVDKITLIENKARKGMYRKGEV